MQYVASTRTPVYGSFDAVCVCVFVHCSVNSAWSLQGYCEADCTVCCKEWDIILGEADVERTEELPV